MTIKAGEKQQSAVGKTVSCEVSPVDITARQVAVFSETVLFFATSRLFPFSPYYPGSSCVNNRLSVSPHLQYYLLTLKNLLRKEKKESGLWVKHLVSYGWKWY